MKYRKLEIFFFGALLVGNTIFAEDENPEDLAKEYFSALQIEGMTTISRYMHPVALSEFKALLVPIFEAELDTGQRHLPNMIFGDGIEIMDLKTMDSVIFMNGVMNFFAIETGSDEVTFDKLEVLGTVEEGKARHVLVRMTTGAGDLALTQFEVLSFVPYKNSWRLQLNSKMRGVARALQPNVQGK